MGNFKDDLIKGKEMEQVMLDKLTSMGWNVIANPNEKEMDIILVEKGIEIKMDDYSLHSGNFYIEFECNGKPSGVFRNERTHLERWCQCNSQNAYMIKGDKLKAYVAIMIDDCRANKSLTSKGVRLVEQGGNGGRTKGLLIPIKKFAEMADDIITLTNTEICD